jgi:hypothetical protein
MKLIIPCLIREYKVLWPGTRVRYRKLSDGSGTYEKSIFFRSDFVLSYSRAAH